LTWLQLTERPGISYYGLYVVWKLVHAQDNFISGFRPPNWQWDFHFVVTIHGVGKKVVPKTFGIIHWRWDHGKSILPCITGVQTIRFCKHTNNQTLKSAMLCTDPTPWT
jgi:hypothetical protein